MLTIRIYSDHQSPLLQLIWDRPRSSPTPYGEWLKVPQVVNVAHSCTNKRSAKSRHSKELSSCSGGSFSSCIMSRHNQTMFANNGYDAIELVHQFMKRILPHLQRLQLGFLDLSKVRVELQWACLIFLLTNLQGFGNFRSQKNPCRPFLTPQKAICPRNCNHHGMSLPRVFPPNGQVMPLSLLWIILPVLSAGTL